jgi:hypothetical protein
MAETDIRELTTDSAWRRAFPVLRQLRQDLTEQQYLERIREMRDCESLTLESGRWREDAHRFYEETLEMEKYCFTFKKELSSRRTPD